MKKIIFLLSICLCNTLYAQSSMRRCTLLPITDSVGGAVGYKVYEQVEVKLQKSRWCNFISNSDVMSIFTKYRENLPQYLKKKEVLVAVGEKLKVGSIIYINIKHELSGIDLEMQIYSDNGKDLYFSERMSLGDDHIESMVGAIYNWLEMYSKMIPYDARVNGILGDQVTLEVNKSYPKQIGQKFIIKREVNRKRHPLLKKIVDWDTEVVAEGKIQSVSDDMALGIIQKYQSQNKINVGDWVRLKEVEIQTTKIKKEKPAERPGTMGILSVAFLGSSSSLDSSPSSGSIRMSGLLYGIDFRVEGWITRNYFAALEVEKSLGRLEKTSGSPTENKVSANNGGYKLTLGYKYLPIGFFFGPQVDFFIGNSTYTYDFDTHASDGFGQNSISGFVMGVRTNIPINRDFRVVANAEFMPLPKFSDQDDIFEPAKAVTSMGLEIGIKFNYTARMTFDSTLEAISRKARFDGDIDQLTYRDTRIKLGASFNF